MVLRATALAGLPVVLAACGVSNQPSASTLTSTLQITKTVTVTAAPPLPVPKTTMETDGTYRVGIDIEPGTYRSGGKSEETADCFWARLSSLNEDDIIANGMSAGAQQVVIKASDRAFYTHDCQAWLKI